jgi:hypothetical protein
MIKDTLGSKLFNFATYEYHPLNVLVKYRLNVRFISKDLTN